MVPRPWRRHRTHQSSNMMRDNSMSFELEDTIVFTTYYSYLCKGTTRRRRVVSIYVCLLRRLSVFNFGRRKVKLHDEFRRAIA